jgi:hypothetical protein
MFLLRAAYVIVVPASDFGLDGTQGMLLLTLLHDLLAN